MYTVIVDQQEIWALRTLLHGWFVAETERVLGVHRRAIETAGSSPEFLQAQGPGYLDKTDAKVAEQIQIVFVTVRALDNILSAATIMFTGREAVLSLPEAMFNNLQALLELKLNIGPDPENVATGEKLNKIIPRLRDAFKAAAVNAANPTPNVTPPPKGLVN